MESMLTIAILKTLYNEYSDIVKTALPHLSDHILGKLVRKYNFNVYTSMCYLDNRCLSAVITEATNRTTESGPVAGDDPLFNFDQLKHIANNMWDACGEVYKEYSEPFFDEWNDIMDRDIIRYIAKHGYSDSIVALLRWRRKN